jgi:hypothetical protein
VRFPKIRSRFRNLQLTNWWHGITEEWLEDGISLHVGSHDDGMLPEVQKESLTAPASGGFDNVKGNAT